MSTHRQITDLWADLRDVIDATYAAGQAKHDANGHSEVNALRDYAQNVSWSNDLAKLLGRETANERQHRSNRSPQGFSVGDAAKLILMGNVLHGSNLIHMPSALMFLTMRQTAAEAIVIGYLVREQLTPEWKDRVAALDYAKLMREVS